MEAGPRALPKAAMRIALDVMGTDEAPAREIAGAAAALDADPELRIALVGDRRVVEDALGDRRDSDRIDVVHAPDRIDASESPAYALRRRPRSSIGVGLELQRSREADAFVSAGPTGAVMAASLLLLRPLEGVDRPTVGTPFPTAGGVTLVVDAGANIECKPQNLVQFARLGAIHMQDLEGVAAPRVGLLNVGAEATKGTDLLQEAHRRLADSGLDFVGNVEGSDIMRHACDVLVCDGFVGNILLKFYESVGGVLVESLRGRLRPEWIGPEIEGVFRALEYAEYGGAPLLGINGVSIVCHGRSSARAIATAIGVAARSVRSGMVSHIARDLAANRNGFR